MAQEVQDGVPQEPTAEWLRTECARLFGQASRAEEPDLASCAKLAELLFKMLPKGSGERQGLSQSDLEAAREAVLAARRQKADG
jgi:hypothetical protein